MYLKFIAVIWTRLSIMVSLRLDKILSSSFSQQKRCCKMV